MLICVSNYPNRIDLSPEESKMSFVFFLLCVVIALKTAQRSARGFVRVGSAQMGGKPGDRDAL